MARKPKIQTRVGRDTKDAIDAYADDHPDASQAEAIRELLRAGLGKKGYPVAVTDGGSPLDRLASRRTVGLAALLLGAGAALLLITGWLAATGSTTGAAVGLVAATSLTVAATVTISVAVLAQIALSRPLRDLLPLTGEVKA